ncbi:MAG TPA: hypothetical protein PKV67_16345, partial [Hyphomonas sp.]|nr:hypothetical protein [Hyphomonas sp.]
MICAREHDGVFRWRGLWRGRRRGRVECGKVEFNAGNAQRANNRQKLRDAIGAFVVEGQRSVVAVTQRIVHEARDDIPRADFDKSTRTCRVHGFDLLSK